MPASEAPPPSCAACAPCDFENELAIAHLNRKLAPEIDTVFFMTGIEHAYLSSSLVREIAAFGGDVSAMVPDVVARTCENIGAADRAPLDGSAK